MKHQTYKTSKMSAEEIAELKTDGSVSLIGKHGNIIDVIGKAKKVVEFNCWVIPTDCGTIIAHDSEKLNVRIHCCTDCRRP